MDMEERARRQSRRVIISEIIMVIAVIVTVSILAFVVSGYWVGSDFTIERQGMLQIYSNPTGADVTVDNETGSWLQRTNTSKTLSAGEHTITLTKDGYDSWSRTINISEGLLYRLHYPRLFLENRTQESAFDFSANSSTESANSGTNSSAASAVSAATSPVVAAFITPDRNTMLLANNTTTWQLFNLDSDSAKLQPLNLSAVLPFVSTSAGASDATSVTTFSGQILDYKWATDNEHILLKLAQDGATNWVILNIKNPAASINLTKVFNADFSEVEILDSSASNLLVMMGGNLHRVDASAKQISAVLVPDVASFDHYNQEAVFSAKTPVDYYVEPTDGHEVSVPPYYIGLLRLGSGEITELSTSDAPEKILITKFYDDEYIGRINGASIRLYLKKDFEEKQTFALPFEPQNVKVGMQGEAITMYTGGHLAVLDMEAMQLTDWSTDTESFDWLDGSMIYAVKDGALNVYDFNGLNHRVLASDVSSHFPVTITSDKYLYYFKDSGLVREYLAP